jgi:predicted house-cleaning noncanonical NTP pyrophosphatase (MazG superfamily)
MGGMKLVRDRIPEVMRAAGQAAVVHTADPVEFGVLLRLKLTEEVDEFRTSCVEIRAKDRRPVRRMQDIPRFG